MKKIFRLIRSPEEKPVIHKTEKEYKNHIGTSINHLYEKSLHPKDLMNTVVARELAEEINPGRTKSEKN